MKTPRLVSLCFGILAMATLVHAKERFYNTKDVVLEEKLNALQQAVSTLQDENYDLATAKPKDLEKQLARVMKISAEEVHTILNQAWENGGSLERAVMFLGVGQFSKADQYYDKVLSHIDADPQRLRIAHEGRGIIALEKSGTATALQHYQSALALCNKDTAPLEWAKSASKVGEMLYDLANYKEAELLLRETLRLREEKLGANHPDVAEALGNLAHLLMDTYHSEEVEPLMRRALAIDEASFGKEHPTVALRLNNLSKWLRATNREEEAEPLMRRVLAIEEVSLGKDHPNLAAQLCNLAQMLEGLERFEDAEPLRRRVLTIVEISYDQKSHYVGRALDDLVQVLIALKRFTEAEPIMERALLIFEDSLGKNDPKSISVRIDLERLRKKLEK